MQILTNPDPALRLKAVPVGLIDNPCTDTLFLKKLNEFCKLMYQRDGAGLAAPQVGWGVRLFAIAIPGGEDLVVIDPVIMKRSIATEVGVEQCLSVPGLKGMVRRHVSIKATANVMRIRDVFRLKTVPVEQRILELTDKPGSQHRPARCFQHENDHLDGKLYIDRVESPPMKV